MPAPDDDGATTGPSPGAESEAIERAGRDGDDMSAPMDATPAPAVAARASGDPVPPAEAAREGPRADEAAPLAPTGKAIVLFSDGTGNSSAKLFKTNVYRLYEALDLGPDRLGLRTQIAYYDNGVGTSSNKFLAALGGIFGWGLKRNLRHIYLFLCRNYNPGDRIYAFGFSRGAFTIRLLVAMVCSQGIVGYDDEAELDRNATDAYRRFASANTPDIFPCLFVFVRWLRDLAVEGTRAARGLPWNEPAAHSPDIEFVGLWDTVAAYGGPIAELTRAIDKYVWPLTMTDYTLNYRVKCARHALALDDERDSFLPLLWDEAHEQRQAQDHTLPAETRERYATRLRQVWFAGMHSDVGGGYPDDSLAYVSLVWMIGELDGALRLLPDQAWHIRSFANPLGPIHDSRQGLSAYYRYQPRKIAAFLHPEARDLQPMYQTLILRDPTIGEKKYRPQGLLLNCNVHESVITRIGMGTDNYAPIVLPEYLTIITDAPRAKACAGTASATSAATDGRSAAVALLQKSAIARDRADRQETAWDYVWYRRVTYFATVALSLLMVAFPLWIDAIDHHAPEQDSRWVLGILLGWAGYLVPGFAKPWFDAFSLRPIWFVILGLPILLLLALSAHLERTLRDRTRRLWWSAMDGSVAGLPAASGLRTVRNSYAYQWLLQRLKWGVAPFLVGTGILLAGLVYLPALIVTQIRLAKAEPANAFCKVESASPVMAKHRVTGFRADDPCFDSGMSVKKGHQYRLTWTVDTADRQQAPGWKDGGNVVATRGAPSAGFDRLSRRPLMVLAAPFRRVVSARWLEPLVEIRPPARARATRGVMVERLVERSSGKGLYVGDVTAPYDGALMLFLNDAAPPFGDIASFYGPAPRRGANSGTASVCIQDLGYGSGSGPSAAVDPQPCRDLEVRRVSAPAVRATETANTARQASLGSQRQSGRAIGSVFETRMPGASDNRAVAPKMM